LEIIGSSIKQRYSAGIPNQGELPKWGISVFQEDCERKLSDSDFWNIGLLADLAAVISVVF